jgi:hypothetical protein
MTIDVKKLKAWQTSKLVHPFTCGGNRTDAKHLDGEGVLEPTEDGWRCPFCDYKQPYRSFERLGRSG